MGEFQAETIIATLQERFVRHMSRHAGLDWNAVEDRLQSSAPKLRALAVMEETGGEPDVVGLDEDGFVFCDCSPESPSGRRSLCYDQQALDARKANKPQGNAMTMASAMGIEMLGEAEYRHLQTLGEFDRKTSSWIETPETIRSLGGALFCDRRYDRVFVYHNGADSYYAARGFRGRLIV